MAEYKCLTADFDKLKKRINRITKKLDKYNLKWSFEELGESIEKVNVIDFSNTEGVPSWQFTPKHRGKMPVQVTSYSFEMEHLKLGEYKVVAVIEHNAVIDQIENVILPLDENISIPLKYRTAKSICEHCNSKRQRNKTILLQDNKGNFIQVGKTCLKEYTGIADADVVSIYANIHDIMIEANDLSIDQNNWNSRYNYVDTKLYLANCISLIETEGYKKEGLRTKEKAWDMTVKGNEEDINKQYIKKAEEVISYFANISFNESDVFLNNIRVYLSNPYTKMSGFVAYSYIAWQKQMEKESKRQEYLKKIGSNSEYQGTIGDRIELDLIFHKHIVFDTMYGTQIIYLFHDKQMNMYKWTTSVIMLKDEGRSIYEEGDNIRLKATIKGHEEYQGIKQTDLSRCRLI